MNKVPELSLSPAVCGGSTRNTRLSSSRFLNVIVTGGSSGIGAAIVRTFAEAGHRVLFTYLTGLTQAQQIHDSYPNATHTYLDQADISSIACFAHAVSCWAGEDGVDILINNAALGSATVQRYVAQHNQKPNTNVNSQTNCNHTSNTDIAPKSSDRQHFVNSPSVHDVLERAARDEALLKVNALGPLWVTDAVSDLLHRSAYKKPNGRAVIIFIGSVGGGSSAVFPEYCAADLMSKAAMTYLSKHIAAKYVREPIDVICVSPGATETEMFRKSTLSKVSDPDRFIDSMPKRRLIHPDDIANTIFWLATQSPPGIFHGANLDTSMGLAVRPGLQTETENSR